MKLPKPSSELTVCHAGNETLIYKGGNAHCISGDLATAFRACEQSETLEDLCRRIESKELAPALVADLQRLGFVSDSACDESRRIFLGKTPLRLAALGLILTVTAPEPAAAGS